jgi:hypothetical protein
MTRVLGAKKRLYMPSVGDRDLCSLSLKIRKGDKTELKEIFSK